MKRRWVLAATGSIAITGCLGNTEPLGGASDSPRPTEIIDSDFETGVDTDASRDEPEITVNRDESTVTVEGVGEYGSSSCGYLANQEPDYDVERSELHVEITARQEPPDDDMDCGDDLATSSYQFVIQFDEGVPASIEAEHPFQRTATKETQ